MWCATEPWNWVMSWLDMMPLVSMVALLEKSFFPRWLQVLGNWLAGPNPNYYEITSWYQGWKALFPEQLLTDNTIKGLPVSQRFSLFICFLIP
jgi:tuftelin-interacting protein 11